MSRTAVHDRAPAPRRVLVVINDLLLGGAQRVVLDQAAALDRRRFAPEVASLEIVAGGALGAEFAPRDVPLHRLRRAGEPWLRAVARLDALVARTRPDVVHTHLAAAGVFGRAVARRRGVARLVTTLHNLSDWQEQRRSPLRWADRRTLRWADAVVAVSDAVHHAVAEVAPELASRLVTVVNGIDLDRFAGATAERSAARAALGIAPDAFVVGAVARLDPRKGLDLLLAAAARARTAVPRLEVLVVGDGVERARLEAQAAAPALAGAVRILPHQPRVRGHLAAMDVFAAPSRTEGLGVAAIEALAAGVPVLASRVGGLPEVVTHDGCGWLLPPDDPVAWAGALAKCAADTDRRARWAAAAPARARAFGLAASVAALERVYAPETRELAAAA